MHWERFGDALGTLSGGLGDTLETLWGRFGTLLGQFGKALGSHWGHIGDTVLEVCGACRLEAFSVLFNLLQLFSFGFRASVIADDDEDMEHVYVVGGEDDAISENNGMTNKIYQMYCDSTECKWKTLDQTLPKARSEHIAMWVCSCDFNGECNGAAKTTVTFGVLLVFLGMLF